MDGQIALKGLKGCLSWREAADGIQFSAWAEDRKDGLYKLYLTDGQGEALLGTLIPEGGKLTLARRLACRELEGRGVSRVRGAEARLAFPFIQASGGWHPADDPVRLFQDPVLRAAAEGLTGAVIRRSAGRTQLAIPFVPGRPFPLIPLICLGRALELEGGTYLCFTLDENGVPV